MRVITRLEGGLGNQLFQYAAGRAVAARLGGRVQLDTRWHESPDHRPYELDRFCISGRPLGWWKQLRVRFSSGPRAEGLRRTTHWVWPGAVLPQIEDAERGYDPRLREIHSSVYLKGFWQSWKYFDAIREVLLREFAFRARPDAVNRQLLDDIAGKNAIAVHIRRGDYRSSQHRGKHWVDLSNYYPAAVDYLRQRVADPYLYVFSDDPDWVTASARFGLPMTVVRHNNNSANSEDLRLMKACKHLIIANSTFSWWAAWLAPAAGKIVIAPRRWFGDAHPDPLQNDLIPPEWIRL